MTPNGMNCETVVVIIAFTMHFTRMHSKTPPGLKATHCSPVKHAAFAIPPSFAFPALPTYAHPQTLLVMENLESRTITATL